MVSDVATELRKLQELEAVADRLYRQWKDAVADREAQKLRVGALLDTGVHDVPGIGRVIHTSKGDRSKWQHEELWSALRRVIYDPDHKVTDPDTGEILEGEERAIQVIRDCVSNKWKVGIADKPEKGGLRRYDIDPDEYCETDWVPVIEIQPEDEP